MCIERLKVMVSPAVLRVVFQLDIRGELVLIIAYLAQSELKAIEEVLVIGNMTLP